MVRQYNRNEIDADKRVVNRATSEAQESDEDDDADKKALQEQMDALRENMQKVKKRKSTGQQRTPKTSNLGASLGQRRGRT